MLSDWLPYARILVVDDEPANVDVLESLLAQAGYVNVYSTNNARWVVPLFTSFYPDLILLDWLMPDIDGLGVLRQLQPLISEQTYLPILVLTADITSGARQQALSNGAKDFLTKPFDITEVLLRIRNLLEARYLHLELRRNIAALEAEIVERQRVEVALRSSEADLRKALDREHELNELKTRFVAMTSHEFRTPLSTIFSSAQLLDRYGHRWDEEKRRDHARRIQRAVDQMTRLLDEVLFIGRADAGRLQFQPAPLDLVTFCRGMVEESQLMAGPQREIAFISSSECEPALVDARLLQQILSNLLSNAVKYSPDAGPITLELSCAGGLATFRVTDQGLGIPPEALPYIYEEFHRAANVEHIPGHGLGMAIVKRSVDLHGGTIECQSQPNVGTTFTVRLPLVSRMPVL